MGEASETGLPQFVEFESKYKIDDPKVLWDFKHLVETELGRKDFLYVQSDDCYYVKGDDFIRYRFSDNKKDKRAELTIKRKTNEKNNIIREEVNLRVDGNSFDTVERFVKLQGFEFNFRINKQCHIYYGTDCTLVFYSVRDLETNELSHFIEIEVTEGAGFTEEECWNIIKKYEAALSKLGVSAQRRSRKSLFEMYKREIKNV
jgi:adenylate cyclase class IV